MGGFGLAALGGRNGHARSGMGGSMGSNRSNQEKTISFKSLLWSSTVVMFTSFGAALAIDTYVAPLLVGPNWSAGAPFTEKFDNLLHSSLVFIHRSTQLSTRLLKNVLSLDSD